MTIWWFAQPLLKPSDTLASRYLRRLLAAAHMMSVHVVRRSGSRCKLLGAACKTNRLMQVSSPAGYPTGAVRISFGYMSTFEDAEGVVQLLRDFFVTTSGSAGEHSPPDKRDTPAVSASAPNGSSSGQPSGSGRQAACGCQLPDSSSCSHSSVAPSDTIGSPVTSHADETQRGSFATESHSDDDASAMLRATGGGNSNGASDAGFAVDRKCVKQAGALSSPEEPRTPTREEGGSHGHGRISAAQTVMQAFRRSATALTGTQLQGHGSESRDAAAAAPDGPHVQGLWLYPIKSCAAQVPPCACRHIWLPLASLGMSQAHMRHWSALLS